MVRDRPSGPDDRGSVPSAGTPSEPGIVSLSGPSDMRTGPVQRDRRHYCTSSTPNSRGCRERRRSDIVSLSRNARGKARCAMSPDTPATDERETPGGTEAADRVADVLLLLGRSDDPLGVSRIARDLALSKAVVHRILRSLASRSLIQMAPGRAGYVLGARRGRTRSARGAARPADRRVAGAASPCATGPARRPPLSVLVGDQRVYLDQFESPQEIKMVARDRPSIPAALRARPAGPSWPTCRSRSSTRPCARCSSRSRTPTPRRTWPNLAEISRARVRHLPQRARDGRGVHRGPVLRRSRQRARLDQRLRADLPAKVTSRARSSGSRSGSWSRPPARSPSGCGPTYRPDLRSAPHQTTTAPHPAGAEPSSAPFTGGSGSSVRGRLAPAHQPLDDADEGRMAATIATIAPMMLRLAEVARPESGGDDAADERAEDAEDQGAEQAEVLAAGL